MEISSEVRGFDSAEIRMKGAPAHLREQMLHALGEAANLAEDIMTDNVPEHSGALRQTIHVSPIHFSPGGAGGGGSWQIVVQAGEGIPYLHFVTEGTGVFGPTRAKIRPKTKKYMVFTTEGGTFFKTSVYGQKPQTDWIQFAQYAADLYLKNAIEQFDLEH